MVRKSIPLLAAVLALVVPWCWLFLRPVITGESYAYRDVAHYFYPLWQLVADTWSGADGRDGWCDPPLWNFLENSGQPLAADGTACVFYPVNWLLTRLLPFSLALKWIIAVHAAGAVLAMLFTTRQRGVSWEAATLAAISYGFGGYVVAQHANVIYLIGATWLPLVLFFGARLMQQGRWLNALALAACLALMVLGGDPQSAYHAALMLGGLLMAMMVARFHRSYATYTTYQRAAWLIGAFILSATLAAVQIVPSFELGRSSVRAAFNEPRSIWEYFADIRAKQGHNGAVDSAADWHSQRIDSFHFAPWRIAELIWPNIGGRAYPVHSRWTQQAFREGPIWVPSMYLGCLPLLMAIYGGLRARTRWRWWFMAVAALALLAAMGYSAGLYRLFVWLLPGYSLFRYPSKWLLLFCWAAASLAAEGWDQLRKQQTASIQRWSAALMIITVICWTAFLLLKPHWEALLKHAPGDAAFGPFDIQRAARDISRSLVHSLVVALLAFMASAPRLFARQELRAILLLITASDLLLAHQWQVITVADSCFTRSSPVWQEIFQQQPQQQQQSAEASPIAIGRALKYPRHFSEHASAGRLRELVCWDHDTLAPKYHLRYRRPALNNVHSPTALMTVDRAVLLSLLQSKFRERDQLFSDLLGVRYAITAQPRAADRPAIAADAYLASDDQPRPRAWVAFQFAVADKPPGTRRWADWRGWCQHSLSLTTDVRAVPVVHAGPDELPIAPRDQLPQPVLACVNISPTCLTVSVDLARPGLLVLRDSYAPGWQAEIRGGEQSERVKIWRVNIVQSGVFLPAGKQQVMLRYRPPAFRFAAATSLLSWVGCVVFAISYGASKLVRHFRPTSRGNEKLDFAEPGA